MIKKKAMSTLELLIALSLMAVATLIGINTLRVYINKDTDIVKFKHAFGTLSEVISSLKSDTCMYPDAKGFAYTDIPTNCINGANLTNNTKFKKLFTSKFNILENNITINLDKYIPIVKYSNNSSDELYTKNNKINCFIENKGVTYCPPETSLESSDTLLSIYIPVYINKIDLKDSSSTNINKAIFVEVLKTGKIEIPAMVKNSKGESIIDCVQEEYNNYNHCKILDKMAEINF